MTVPNVPFWASQATAEFGGPWIGTARSNAGLGYAGWASQLGGRSAYQSVLLSLSPPGGSYGILYQSSYGEAVTALPSRGTGSYSYSWSIVSGSGYVTHPSSQTTQVWITGVPQNQTRTVVARCTVSDGVTSASADYSLTLTHDTND